MKYPKIFIISAPSGTGKNTIINHLLKKRNDLSYSISTTTRKPRPGEKDKIHYHFVSPQKFQEMISREELFEWAEILSDYYGTTKVELKTILKKKKISYFRFRCPRSLSYKRKTLRSSYYIYFSSKFGRIKKKIR